MRATVMYGAGDVRVENVPDARLVEPTDALVRVTHACICGSDLWPYKTMEPQRDGRRMGHEFVGVVEAVGADVRTLKAGDVVVMPFAWSDGTCVLLPRGAADVVPPRRFLRHRRASTAAQAEAVRVPLADGTLFVLPVGRGRRADAVAAHALRRDGHRPPCGARRAGSGPARRWRSSATARSACAA